MRSIRTRLFLGVLAFAASVVPSIASACMCMSGASPDELVADASLIFAGTLLRTEKCTGEGAFRECHEGVFSVAEAFKGKLGDTVTLRYERQDGVNCGAVFRRGAAQLVVANGSAKSGYFASGCNQPDADLTSYSNTYLLAARRYRVALNALDAALAKDPGSARLLYKKAAFLTEWKAIEEGLEAVEQVLAKEPNSPAALELKADLLTMIQQDQAASQIRDALSAATPPVDQRKRREVDALVRAGRLKDVPAGWLDFAGIDANYISWRWRDRPLDGANFSKAQLVGARFEGTTLKGAIFDNANLDGANFESADMTGASLIGANITGQFRAKLSNADLSGATGRPQFYGSDLTGALLLSVAFERVDFQQTKMAGAVLAGAKAPGSHFTLADLSGADLSYAALDGATFRGAVLRGANLTGASFRGYDNQPADFIGADLEGAILDGATFTSAIYDCDTKWPTGFDPGAHGMLNYHGDYYCRPKPDFSWLREPFQRDRYGLEPVDTGSGMVTFAEQHLPGVSFRGAWLPTSDFVNANLISADFSHVRAELDVRGADLTNANLSFVDLTRWKVDQSTTIDRVKLHGARILIRSVATSGIDHPDLAKMDFHGAIVLGHLPEGIDPAEMGIVFYGGNSKSTYLRGADLRGFNLQRVNFMNTDLSGTDLRGAILNDADFRGAILTGTKFLGACYGIHTRWPEGFDRAAAGVVYCGEYRNGARRELPPPDMPVPNLAGEDLSEREFEEAFLLNANMDQAKLAHARFYISHMKGASLRSADLTGASLIGVVLEGADLTGASLRNADLRGARLSDANLTKADLTDAVYNLGTVWPVGFDPVAAGAKKVTD
jgi:uncharacterized protein YjbI with pentapeptide repeats